MRKLTKKYRTTSIIINTSTPLLGEGDKA